MKRLTVAILLLAGCAGHPRTSAPAERATAGESPARAAQNIILVAKYYFVTKYCGGKAPPREISDGLYEPGRPLEAASGRIESGMPIPETIVATTSGATIELPWSDVYMMRQPAGEWQRVVIRDGELALREHDPSPCAWENCGRAYCPPPP